MTDRVQTVALMAATLEAHGSPASVRKALALYQEVERQVAAAYPAPKSKELPECTCWREATLYPPSSPEHDCSRHGA